MLHLLRMRMLLKIEDLITALQLILLPVKNDDSGLLKFTRCRLVQTGWIWGIFPRLDLQISDQINLDEVTKRSIVSSQKDLMVVAKNNADKIRELTNEEIGKQADRARQRMREQIENMVGKSEDPASVIMTRGHLAIQDVQQAILKTVGQATAEHFRKEARKSLVQIMTYARKECGAEPEIKQALPIGTRFVYYRDPITLYIIEEAPQVRTVIWDHKKRTLSFPYIVFLVSMKNEKFYSLQVFFRNKRLKTPTNRLFAVPLPDVYRANDGSKLHSAVCFPSREIENGTANETVLSVLQVFWGSSFTSEHFRNAQIVEKFGFFMDRWFKDSTENPLAVLEYDWPSTDYTIEKAVNDLKLSDSNKDTAKQQLSQLEQYINELGERMASNVQEAALEEIGHSNKPAKAKAFFDAELKKAMNEIRISERVSELIRTELRLVCDDPAVGAAILQSTEGASRELGRIVSSATENVFKEVSKEVSETINNLNS